MPFPFNMAKMCYGDPVEAPAVPAVKRMRLDSLLLSLTST